MNKFFQFGKNKTQEGADKIPRFLHFPIQQQILFVQRLSLLIKAGIPIGKALRMLEKQATTKSTKFIYNHLVRGVENGQLLSNTMAKLKKVFGAFAINIVQIGESSGTLQENLNYLGEELRKKQALQRKVRSALVYPTFIVVATFGITILLTVYVFPKILPIFESFKYQLPWPTRVLIFVSNLLLHQWMWLLLGLAIIIAAIILLLRQPRFRYQADRLLLRVPILGRLFQSYYMANFTRTFGLLLKSSVPIVRAIHITAQTVTNSVYQKEFEEISAKVMKGEKISSHTESKPKLFPSMLSQMIYVGETAGNLPNSLFFLAEMYENEVDDTTKNLSTVLEPALMVFMGLLVGFVAISIITPIYGFTQNLHP
jgi:type IV pilus assembly protein PilC